MVPIIISSVVLVVLIIIWSIYNKLVKARNISQEGFSGIDVQLKKRFELIPSLIEAVKGYNSHEAELLVKITKQRTKQNDLKGVAANDYSTTTALKNFRVQIEAYPDLKSNIQFLKLMDNLSSVEKDLAMARRYYNGTVRELNNSMEVFPNVLFAKKFGFIKAEFYQIEVESERDTPSVNL